MLLNLIPEINALKSYVFLIQYKYVLLINKKEFVYIFIDTCMKQN